MSNHTIERGSPAQREIRKAWRSNAVALAVWVLTTLVNRRDVRGGYYAAGGRVCTTTRQRGLNRVLLVRHFGGHGTDDVAGVHVTGPDEMCRWVVIDVDAHEGDGADPSANFRFVRHLRREVRLLGGGALLIDSNGSGGFHLWIIFPKPVPSERAFRFAKWLVRDHAAFGLARPPETFPKSPRLTRKRIGGFVRLPGLHHKRTCWSRVWNGRRWLEGEEATQAILGTRRPSVDVSLAVPSGFDPRPPRRPARAPRRHGADRGASQSPPPSRRDIVLARRALSHLGDDYRDDYRSWLTVGMALRELGDAGLKLWHGWSRSSPKYDRWELEQKWWSFGVDRDGDGCVRLGTLFHLARQHGFEFPRARPKDDGWAIGMRPTSFTLTVPPRRSTDLSGGRP